MAFRVLFSNLGYARGIDGTLGQHLGRLRRHFYTNMTEQQQVLAQFRNIILRERPDLCCIVEIDSGSWNTGFYNQIGPLLDREYAFHDIAGKYGEDSTLARMPFFSGKCNAYVSKTPLPSEKVYFRNGSKRLLYSLGLPGGVRLFFSHFSLQKNVRARQFDELREMIAAHGGEVIVLADFNILHGFDELKPLLCGQPLRVLSREEDHTFMFGAMRRALDLCLCSESLGDRIALQIIPQPFSDHAALLLDVDLQDQSTFSGF